MECLANYINNAPYLLALILQCFNASACTKFVESAIAYLQTQQLNHNPNELFSHFADFVSSGRASSKLKASVGYPSLTAAFIQYRENHNEKKNFRD